MGTHGFGEALPQPELAWIPSTRGLHSTCLSEKGVGVGCLCGTSLRLRSILGTSPLLASHLVFRIKCGTDVAKFPLHFLTVIWPSVSREPPSVRLPANLGSLPGHYVRFFTLSPGKRIVVRSRLSLSYHKNLGGSRVRIAGCSCSSRKMCRKDSIAAAHTAWTLIQNLPVCPISAAPM